LNPADNKNAVTFVEVVGANACNAIIDSVTSPALLTVVTSPERPTVDYGFMFGQMQNTGPQTFARVLHDRCDPWKFSFFRFLQRIAVLHWKLRHDMVKWRHKERFSHKHFWQQFPLRVRSASTR
jgi:hypothetical protein